MGIETAIIGATAVGAAASASAAKKSSKSSKAALSSADEASKLQYEVSMEQLNFQKEQYANWENIFGPIQQNLSNYYKNISSDSISSAGIQSIMAQHSQSRQTLDTELAKRGLPNSGATVQGLTSLESAAMLGKAQVQANAPMVAAQQKTNFLSGGLTQQNSLVNGISNAYGNQANMYGNKYTANQSLATQYSNQAAQAYSGIGSSIGTGISSYMNYQSNQALINSLNNSNNGVINSTAFIGGSN